MKIGIRYLFLLFAVCVCVGHDAQARKLHNRHFKFRLVMPAGLARVHDTTGLVSEDIYYDTSANIILVVSGRQSKYKSVKEYIDCTHQELEHDLRNSYGDPDLTLVSCRRFIYYPEKTTVVQFRVKILPYGFDTYMIYFIHHRKKDIQLSFTYKKSAEEKSVDYIERVMQTLRLR